MYEIIDLSQIDRDGHNAEKEVIELIKPFRRRTTVFPSHSIQNSFFVDILKEELKISGFHVYNAPFYTMGWPGNAPIEDLQDLIKQAIINSQNDGYVIGLISNFSHYSLSEYIMRMKMIKLKH